MSHPLIQEPLQRDYRKFPDGFQWGAATSAFQVEGATRADGRGKSIWDTFCATPGKVIGGDTGETACDQYHRWPQDLDLMADLGVKAYRFSIAWPRIVPLGTGAVNPKGLEFYDRLVDALLAKNILPCATLYHWDLPQPLQDRGGWCNRETVAAFGEYVQAVAQRLGDRVPSWMTFNEITIFLGQGYQQGIHAPGLQLGPRMMNQAYHHVFLAHGLAVQLLRAAAKPGAEIGVVDSPGIPVPLMETPACLEATRKKYIRRNGRLMQPLFQGGYPDWWLREQGADAPEIRAGDLEQMRQPVDFLGVNVYTGTYIREAADDKGYEEMEFPLEYPTMALDWLKQVPQALYWGCRHAREVYGVEKFYITEAGCACDDRVDDQGRVVDLDRLQWLRAYLAEAHRATAEGIGLAGFFAWSLMDNFEWAEGYAKRFGIVHVDFATQRRIVKESGKWYSEVMRQNRLV